MDEKLLAEKWPGPIAFVNELKTAKLDGCHYLEGAIRRFQRQTDTVHRILLTFGQKSCLITSQITVQYLEATDPVLKTDAINLADKLPKPIQVDLKERILNIKNTTTNTAVKAAAEKFLSQI